MQRDVIVNRRGGAGRRGVRRARILGPIAARFVMSTALVPIAAGIVMSAALLPTAAAHHSFAPHFDASKPVEITGVITEYEQRNPHAYLHVAAEDENGLTREYVCESHGVTQLARNGITPAMLQPGVSVTLTGSQARRDPYMCFFDTVALGDGRVLNVNGTPAAAASSAEEPRDEIDRNDIYGTWMLVPANRSTSGPQPMMAALTEAGRRAVEAYDPFTDDPVFRCDPVAIRRVWFAPGTPLEIARRGDDVVLRFEWMDVERVVHIGESAFPSGDERSSLGYSIGRFEGDTLIVETANYAAGVLRQYVETPGEPTRGMLHSDALTTTERIRFNDATNRLEVEIEHSDPLFYDREFEVAAAEYRPTDLALEPFGCRPENADHTLVE